MKKGMNFKNDGCLTPIEESPRKPSIFGNHTTVLFNKTAKDTKQIFMSAQRRFKGNYLYNTTSPEHVFNSVPIEVSEVPGPGMYTEPSNHTMSNLEKRKESWSKGGLGVGFASKTNRFPENALKTGVLKPQNLQVELIYARASSTPGPGHYEKD